MPGPRHSAAGEEGGGITSNTHRSFSLDSVSVVVGCLVLDTAPQGKRGVTSNSHRSFFFGQLPCCLESCGVVTWEGRGCCAFALFHVADVVVVVVVDFP